MKKILFALTALFTVASAQAGLITPPVTTSISPPNPANELAAFTAEFYPGDSDLVFLAKWDDGGFFEEVISGLNAAAAFGLTDNGAAYDVSWNMTGQNFEVWGVIVKNGGNPTHNLYDVDPSGNMRVVQPATEVLSAASRGQAISHISFIGKRTEPGTPGGNLPDVATGVAYAGVGLVMAVASIRRRRVA